MSRTSKVQQRSRTLPDGEYRQRCYGCYRPNQQCFCDFIPSVQNRTDILILQHQRERSHPFNTARIVNKALQKSELIFDRNESFAKRELPIYEGAALLYPGKDARLIDDLAEDEKPKQLVVIDGTWDQARTLFRDVPQLQKLPQLKLAPTTPGQYRIRREPTATSLSTLEATVQSLQQLEPETIGLDLLLQAFDKMVQQQLDHPLANYGDGSPRPKMETLNIPASFARDLASIVVAYGEATPVSYQSAEGWSRLNRKKKLAAKLPPVFWVAERLDGSASFRQAIKPADPISIANLNHMQLSESDFESAISVESFAELWDQFLQPDDLLVVPNQKTIRLLNHAGAHVPVFELLKAINFDPRNEFSGASEFLQSIPYPIAAPIHPGRAGKRLAVALALVKHLRSRRER